MISPRTNPDEFLKELNLAHLEAGEKEKVLMMLEKRFDEVILNTVIGQLSDEGFEALKTAIKSDDPEGEIAKVTAQVPGLAEEIERRIIEEYRVIKAVMAEGR
jgi:hypothetical protein